MNNCKSFENVIQKRSTRHGTNIKKEKMEDPKFVTLNSKVFPVEIAFGSVITLFLCIDLFIDKIKYSHDVLEACISLSRSNTCMENMCKC